MTKLFIVMALLCVFSSCKVRTKTTEYGKIKTKGVRYLPAD